MANFSPINPGGWNDDDDLTALQVNWFQDSIQKTANFSDGSSHAPTVVVEVAAAGMLFTDTLRIDSDSQLTTVLDGSSFKVATGAVAFVQTDAELDIQAGADLIVDGTVTLNNAATFVLDNGANFNAIAGSNMSLAADEIDITAGLLDISAPTVWRATADPQMDSGCAWSWNSGSSLAMVAGSTCTLGGTNTFSGAITRTGKETRSGAGARTRKRAETTLTTNSDNSVDVTVDSYRYIQSTAVARTITCKIASSVTPEDGEEIRLRISNNSAAVVHVKNEGAGVDILYVTNANVVVTLAFSTVDNKWHCVGTATDSTVGGVIAFGDFF